MKKLLLPVFAAAAFAATAFAGTLDDASAGLDALHRASFEKAVTLFSGAIASGDLSKDDLEFAYYNRGIAYLWQKDYKAAAADFKKAVSMRPDDDDAQNYLDFAEEYLERKPPDMPMDLDKAVKDVVGTLFSPLLKGNTVAQWLEIDPLLQHCLTFKYGMEPMRLASSSITPDDDMLDEYFEGCQKILQSE